MTIRKEMIENFKLCYLMKNSREPTLSVIADDLNRNHNYIRQIFAGKKTSNLLAKEIVALADMEVGELFE